MKLVFILSIFPLAFVFAQESNFCREEHLQEAKKIMLTHGEDEAVLTRPMFKDPEIIYIDNVDKTVYNSGKSVPLRENITGKPMPNMTIAIYDKASGPNAKQNFLDYYKNKNKPLVRHMIITDSARAKHYKNEKVGSAPIRGVSETQNMEIYFKNDCRAFKIVNGKEIFSDGIPATMGNSATSNSSK